MKFSARDDIEAPIDFVFDAIADFAAFERSAMRRGADVQRTDGGAALGVGATWRVQFRFRGKERVLKPRIESLDRPNGYVVRSVSGGLESGLTIELVQLSPKRTRLQVDLELMPKSLSARLMVQSMKLARTTLTRRFSSRVSQYAQEVEDRFGKG